MKGGPLITKVRWPAKDKLAFQEEAESHGFSESQYGRFILDARKDPILFLQMCRLRDPAFAHGLAGNPGDVTKLAEVEKERLELRHANAGLIRERDEAQARVREVERQLSEALRQVQDMAARVVSLSRVQELNRETAMDAGAPYEESPSKLRAIARVLSATPRLLRVDLLARLAADGLSPKEAEEAIKQARREGFLVTAPGGRLQLASPVEEASA